MVYPLHVSRFRPGEAPEYLAQAWRLRYRVFKEQLGWEVNSADLLEFDGFDRKAIHCAVLEGNRVVGYWRALSTAEPYLLETSFPDLLPGGMPKSSLVWEISRFAVDPGHRRSREIGKILVREIAAFGQDIGATELIAVTDPVFERFVKLCGLRISRIAGPMVVGTGHDGDVEAVVILCTIDAPTLEAVGLSAHAA
jgi:acyl homoserine lactone synthase